MRLTEECLLRRESYHKVARKGDIDAWLTRTGLSSTIARKSCEVSVTTRLRQNVPSTYPPVSVRCPYRFLSRRRAVLSSQSGAAL